MLEFLKNFYTPRNHEDTKNSHEKTRCVFMTSRQNAQIILSGYLFFWTFQTDIVKVDNVVVRRSTEEKSVYNINSQEGGRYGNIHYTKNHLSWIGEF